MGVDAIMLKNWLCSEGEDGILGILVIQYQSPSCAAYRALNDVRELAGNKKPGVRPIGFGEIFMRLFLFTDLIMISQRQRVWLP